MKTRILLFILALVSYLNSTAYGETHKTRIFVVSSYHREYLWSQETQRGLCAAMRHSGYLDNQKQIEAFTRDDFVESSTAVIQKAWMDTKKKYSSIEIAIAEMWAESRKSMKPLTLPQ